MSALALDHALGHRRRSGWNAGGGRIARAEGGLVPNGVGYGERVSPL